MKRQIAIVTRKMITGGVERALILMLREFNPAHVCVDLYLQELGGELFHEIPDWVNVIHMQTINLRNVFFHPILSLKGANIKLKLKQGLPYVEQCRLASKLYLPIWKHYDIAIAYHAPNTVPVFLVIDKINAERKILWLHGDMESNQGLTKDVGYYYCKYDKIFAVAKSIYDSFTKAYPEKKNCTEVFYNYIDLENIINKSNEIIPLHKCVDFIILTVARLDKQKGIDLAINAADILDKNGFDFRWYVCGDGEERANLEKMIRERELDKKFILLGNQKNPYSYIKECDLYVQPSRHEGYCTTTNEARFLIKPVITTDVSGAREQFENGISGWIVPISAEAIAEQIAMCIANPERMNIIQDNLKERLFQNRERIEKIWD